MAMALLWGTVSHAQRVSMHVRNVSLRKVIEMISKQVKIGFLYDSELLKGTSKVSLFVDSGSVEDVLKGLLDKQGLTCTISNNFCYISQKLNFVFGKVITETGEPLQDVTVVAGNRHAVLTDKGGRFLFDKIRYGDTLSFYHLSYMPNHIVYNGFQDMRVILRSVITELDTIRVLVDFAGYMPKERATGAYSVIGKKVPERQVSASILYKLESAFAGLLINPEGAGARYNQIQIRGKSSIGLVPGSLPYNEPLVIIDGVPFAEHYSLPPVSRLNVMGAQGKSSFAELVNPNDVESITVLKSGVETACYGSSGANGVIVINTKKGRAYTQRQWEIDAATGIGQYKVAPNMMNTQQYLAMRREAFKNDNTLPSALTAPDLVQWDTTRFTDFSKSLLQTRPSSSNLHVNVKEGGANTQLYLSGSYHNETTPLLHIVNFDKYTFSGHVTQKLAKGKIKIEAISQFASNKNTADLTYLAGYLYLPPNIPSTSNDTYSVQTTGLNASVVLKYSPLPFLDLLLRWGHNSIQDFEYVQLPVRWRMIYPSTDPLSSDYLVERSYKSQLVEPQLQYEIKHNQIKCNFLLGAAVKHQYNRADNIVTVPSYYDSVFYNTPVSHELAYNKYNFVSYLSHVGFQLKDTYLASIVFRRDGSGLLRPNGRYGNFGAIGGAWVFSNDSAFKRLFPAISYGKLTGSYAITGNDQFDADNYFYNRVFPSVALQGGAATVPFRVTQSDYSWEMSHKLDLGIALEYNRQVSLAVDLYLNRTGNQITGVPDPVYGLQAIRVINSPAVVQNKGVEITLGLKSKLGKKVSWYSSLVLNLPHNKLISFPGLANSPYANTLVPGRSITVQQGYQFTGVNTFTGLFQMADLNKDGRIDRYHDYRILDNLDPRIYGSVQVGVKYANWNLDVFLDGRVQKGYSRLSWLYANIVPGASMVNLPVEFLNRWRKPGDQAGIQRLSANNSTETKAAIDQYLASDATLVSTSYLRISNVSLNYKISFYRKEHTYAGQLAVYLTASNLFTFKKDKERDPYTQNIFRLPLQTSLTGGVRFTF